MPSRRAAPANDPSATTFIHDYEVLLNQESMNMALITAIVKD
jgi:hypothetical protein